MKKIFLSATAIATVMSASALAADLSSIKSAPTAPAPLWTGFYAGLNSGYGWGLTPGAYSQTSLFNDEFATNLASSPSGLGAANTGTAQINQNGYVGGAQLGYNKLFYARYLVGMEVDIQGSSISGQGNYSGAGVTRFNLLEQNISGFGETQARINWFGTVRGRFGYLITPSLLTYATGGLTYAGVSATNTYGSLTYEYYNYGRTQSQQLLTGSGRGADTLYGWNIGGGAEWMFSPNWSLKSEVIYYNLGGQTISGFGYSPNPETVHTSQATLNQTTINYAGIIARAGLNYHLNFEQSSYGSFLPLSIMNPLSSNQVNTLSSWTGLYAGLNAGYGWSGHGINTVADAYDASVYWHSQNNRPIGNGGLSTVNSGWSSVNQGGFLGGFQAGYNYQYGSNIVVGLETDIQGSTMNGSGSFSGQAITPTYNTSNHPLQELNYYAGATSTQAGMDWFGSMRGRLGYLIKPSLLIFGTGGLSYGGVYAQTNFSSSTLVYNVSSGNQDTMQMLAGKGFTTNSLVGWNAGAGLEWMLMQNWSLKAEAIYYDLGSMNLKGTGYSPDTNGFGSTDYQFVSTNTSIRYNGVISRMGVNYHFDLGKEFPVVAKY
jgi:outer membrane immunogenic protein